MSLLHHPAQQGMTLIEIICALIILAILATGGISLYQRLLQQTRLSSASNQLLGLLLQARQLALSHHAVLVCAAHSNCNDFPDSQGLILVIDSNVNQQRDPGETLAARVILSKDSHLSWHSFRNLSHLTYQQNGISYFQNGHLLLCVGQDARKLVVNWIGRPHLETVKDLSVCQH